MSSAEPPRSGPPRRTRLLGRAQSELVARVPGAWRVLRKPVERFWENMAPNWDERVRPDEHGHLAPLIGAMDELGLAPGRILDVGTGTGAGALWLAGRFPDAEVMGLDISQPMIERARAKAEGRARFEVGDTGAAASHGPFDLVTHLNCPVLFREAAAALGPGGTVVVAASSGSRTPYYTSHSALRRGFQRAGLSPAGEGRAGNGTWFAARREAAG